MKEHQENENSPLELAVLAGKILLSNGAEIFRVQETMERIAASYHMDTFHVYAISNGIFACGTENGVAHTAEIRHVPLSPVHLGRVAAVNQLSREIAEGKHTVPEAFARLREIQALPFTADWIQILASGIGSGCFCYLFGGSPFDCVVAFFCGLMVYLFVLAAGKKHLSKIMTNILASAVAAFCGLFLFRLGLGHDMSHIIIGSIIPLVPGVPLTNSIRDFFNGDYISGTIRLIDTLLIAACIAIGVGCVLMIANMLGISVGVPV